MKNKYSCSVLGAVDGDTFVVLVTLGLGVYFKIRIRIAGINCCEMHDPDPEKKAKAQQAKEFASKWENPINSAEITHYGYDKYGRSICDLSVNGKDYATEILAVGLADKVNYKLQLEL
jgi:endonuclease YncB( thermonuclease family)